MSGGKGGGGGGGTQRTIVDLPAWQKPFVNRAFDDALSLYENNNLEFFPGQTVAGRNPYELQARQGLTEYAQGGAQQSAQQLMDALAFQSNATDISNNPALEQAIQAAIRPTTQNLMENVLPSIQSGAQGAGQVGGSRQGIAEGLAISRSQQQAGDIAATMANQAYGQGLEAQSRALALGPQIMQAGAMPASLMGQVGQAERTYEQALIDEAMQRFNFEQQAPYNELQQYLNVVGQNFGGTTTTQNMGPDGGGLGRLLGGIGGGAATAMALGGGPVGWSIGGLMALSSIL